MSLEKGFSWTYKNYNFKGYSIAGQMTSIVFENAKICFDIAQGLPFNLNSKLFCISHLHADHGSGLNYLLSQRSLMRLPTANIMLPASNIDNVRRILKEWEQIEGFEYDYKLHPVEHGFTYHHDKQYLIKAFSTTHRVTSFGYIVYLKKKKLKAEFQNMERQEILDIKSRGQEIEEEILVPIIGFTGDTQIEFIESHPDFLKCEVLFVECTYLDNKKSLEQTRHWGHLHLDELIENFDRFENEHISLIHLSARYPTRKAEEILRSAFADDFGKRVSIFPRP